MRKLNCFLAGSKNLSVDVLDTLVDQGHNVKGVLSRDHEPGMQVWLKELGHRSLKERAVELNIPVYENIGINSADMLEILKEADLDIMFSSFWGEIVKETVLNLPRLGFFNLHTAYLPYNRGSFPMAWALIQGEEFCGLTIHKMLPGVDDGPIVDQVKVQIKEKDTAETLYKRVTEEGAKLFKSVLPSFASLSYSLKPFDNKEGTYNPRGYPFGRQINPYWSSAKKDRFKRALTFPPFDGPLSPPDPVMTGYSNPSVRVLCGFDCDRPRGSFIASDKGSEMAKQKFQSLNDIKSEMNGLDMPRTFFICGNFLESMSHKFGDEEMKNAFDPSNGLVEIADHTYSHDILASIPTRMDKKPMRHQRIKSEIDQNTKLFNRVFDGDYSTRGFRTPLGHYKGLSNSYKAVDSLKRNGIKYISSDIRDSNFSLHPQLEENEVPRQPYRYKNGMLEIPAHGWQDTAFSGGTSTKLFEKPPMKYDDILTYYRGLLKDAFDLAQKHERDIFLGLVMHPFDVAIYAKGMNLFTDLLEISDTFNASWHKYEEVYHHYSA